MECLNFRIRMRDYKKYIYCKKKKKEIMFKDCMNCKYKEFKEAKELKKKSNKLKRLEVKRYSILTKNLNICYICNKNKKDDLHEVFGGSNRQKSMVWGLVIPICRSCHSDWDVNEELRKAIQQVAKKKFLENNTKEKFKEEFGKNYVE